MAGNTSLMAVKVLANKGITTESLNGGISSLSQGKGKQLPELIRVAAE
jgi:rhodanese-related sulfurtransferase